MDIINKENIKISTLEKDLVKKQEVLNRLMREIDDKSDSIKLAASEIIDLKRKLHKIGLENQQIQEEANRMKHIDEEMISNRKDLMSMDDEEVKNRIISIAQGYRDERKRNENLEDTLKRAQKDIAGRTHMLGKLKDLEEKIKEIDSQGMLMEREFGRVRQYKETISKQEAMILKLEVMLKDMASDTREIRKDARNFEELLLENEKLKNQINGFRSPENLELSLQCKQQIKNLDLDIENLREQISSQRPPTREGADLRMKLIDHEVRLEEELAKTAALEVQIRKDVVKYSQEIMRLKAVIEEKNAIIKALDIT